MAVMQVADVMDAKSGKSLRIKLGSQWYGAYKDSGITKGMVIDPIIETLDKGGPWIVRYTQSSSAPQAQQVHSPLPANPPSSARAEPDDNIQPWWSAFMSNVVAHAIDKGLAANPEAINQWALKAAQVAVATKEAVK